MKNFSIRALAALLTFSIGVGCGSIWMIHRYSQDQRPMAVTPIQPTIPSDTFITLERTGCYGTCPSYTLAISADGTIIFSGSYYSTVNGGKQWKRSGVIRSYITPEQLHQLLTEFEKANYFSLQNSYRDVRDGCPTYATDSPSAYTSIQINGQKKAIEHYLGCLSSSRDFAGYPKELVDLENRIDEIVNTKQWMQ
jgi:hypothetical protein